MPPQTYPPFNPHLGQRVLYESKNGDGVLSPAVVLRTRATTKAEVIERWGPAPDGTLSGKGRPEGLIAELPDDFHVDLLVHGLGGDYREFCIGPGDGPGTWRAVYDGPDRPLTDDGFGLVS